MKSPGNFTFYHITILFFTFNITLSVYSLPPVTLDFFVFTSYFPVHVLLTAEDPPLLAVYWSIPVSAAPTVPALEGGDFREHGTLEKLGSSGQGFNSAIPWLIFNGIRTAA